MKPRRSLDPKARAFAQVHHYGVRDLASFVLAQAADGKPVHRDRGSEGLDAVIDRNEEEALSLAAKSAALCGLKCSGIDQMSDGLLLRLRHKAVRQCRVAAKNLGQRKDIAALHDAILGAPPAPAEARESMVSPFRLPVPLPVFSSVRAE